MFFIKKNALLADILGLFTKFARIIATWHNIFSETK